MSNPSTTPMVQFNYPLSTLGADAPGWWLPTFRGPQQVRTVRCDEQGRPEWVTSGSGLDQSSWAVSGSTLLYGTAAGAQAAYELRQARLSAAGGSK